MEDKIKYTNIDDVIDNFLKREVYTYGGAYYDAMNNTHSNENVIITEDADFEIIQPKQIEDKK